MTSASGALLDPREAAYQAYTALGSNDVTELLERQFPVEEKLDGEAATPEPGAETEPPETDETTGEEQVAEARAQEAMPPFPAR